MKELKPCPFCGRTETLSVDTEANTCTGNLPQQWYASVICICFDGDFCCPVTGEGATEEEAKAKAIDAWNTRPIEDALRAELARKDEETKALNELVEAHDNYLLVADEVAEIRLECVVTNPIPPDLKEKFQAAYGRRNSARARLAKVREGGEA